MYIVFEQDEIEQLHSKYLLLEMDTIKISNDKTITAHAVIPAEFATFQEISTIDEKKLMHETLMKNYKSKKWDFCEDAISRLNGSFKGEMDSFYKVLAGRIKTFKDNGTDENWSPVITKKNS